MALVSYMLICITVVNITNCLQDYLLAKFTDVHEKRLLLMKEQSTYHVLCRLEQNKNKFRINNRSKSFNDR